MSGEIFGMLVFYGIIVSNCSFICFRSDLEVDLDRVRKRAADLDDQLQSVRKQLFSERFEKERAIQELRRHGLIPPIAVPGNSSTRLGM